MQLVDAFEKDYFKTVIHLLEKELADKDPVQLEQVKEIVKHHFFLMYPFEPEEISPAGWAEASLRQLRAYYEETGLELENELDKDVRKSLAFMRKLDEISSPIM